MKQFLWFTKTYVRPHWPQLILIFVLGLIVSAVPVASIQFVRLMLDNVFAQKDVHTLKFISVTVVGLYLIGGLSRYVHFTMQRGLGELMVMHLRNDLYSHILRLPLKVHSKHHSGSMLTRVVNDGQKIPEGIMLGMDFIREPLTLLGFLITAFYSSWRLTVMVLVIAPIVIFLIAKIGTTVRRYTHRSLEQYGVLGVKLNESFQGMRIIKAFSIEVLMRARFLTVNRELYKRLFKTYRIEELSTPLVEFIGSLAISVVIYMGGSWVISGKITSGEFLSVFIALGLAQGPIKKINSSNLKFQAAIAAIARVREIFDIPMEKTRQGVQLNEFKKSLEFKNVSFKYPEEENYVLKNINLKINKGEVVALVGESGSGKTTIANLIPKFYDVDEGEIIIDGKNINELSLKSLRENIAIVSQDTFLFNDSVHLNILSGKRMANNEEIIEAAKAANAYDFITKMPEAFETQLGERGLRLSGGERQRITIARAIIKGAPILILDEATSALDSNSELEVQKALKKLMEGKTTLVIAHRLSTIQSANRIVVLDQGKIVEEGTHDELIKANGHYKSFYHKQYGDIIL